ncbi:lactate utilization protein B/C [Flavobacterium sp.]|uniref:lactate utilization protein B/C n=1 Tax=Flavobacterium sp. TaxID=239 RepID=UPI00260983A9|nr:lactate utilization protein B/C [Flavobacterium sp.]
MSIFKKFFNSSTDNSGETPGDDLTNLHAGLTTDELFTLKFRKNGGKFLYCENMAEVKTHFEDILEENDWFEQEAMCFEPKLFSLLDENKIPHEKTVNPKFLLASCENLIAEEGSVLLSSNQIKHHKPQELPANFVIFATTSQLVQTKSDSLRTIKQRYDKNYPSNIMAFTYFEKSKEEDFLHYGSVAKNLYLLLLEDA